MVHKTRIIASAHKAVDHVVGLGQVPWVLFALTNCYNNLQCIQFMQICFRSRYLEITVWPDWAIYWTLGKHLSQSPLFLGNFCKGVKIYHISSEIILGNFYKHLAIFVWSHCLRAGWHCLLTWISLASIPATFSKSGTQEDVRDGLEVWLIAVLVGPNWQGNCSQCADFLPSIVCSTPA